MYSPFFSSKSSCGTLHDTALVPILDMRRVHNRGKAMRDQYGDGIAARSHVPIVWLISLVQESNEEVASSNTTFRAAHRARAMEFAASLHLRHLSSTFADLESESVIRSALINPRRGLTQDFETFLVGCSSSLIGGFSRIRAGKSLLSLGEQIRVISQILRWQPHPPGIRIEDMTAAWAVRPTKRFTSEVLPLQTVPTNGAQPSLHAFHTTRNRFARLPVKTRTDAGK